MGQRERKWERERETPPKRLDPRERERERERERSCIQACFHTTPEGVVLGRRLIAIRRVGSCKGTGPGVSSGKRDLVDGQGERVGGHFYGRKSETEREVRDRPYDCK